MSHVSPPCAWPSFQILLADPDDFVLRCISLRDGSRSLVAPAAAKGGNSVIVSENVGPRDDERGWSGSFLGAGRGMGRGPVYRAAGCA